MNRSLALASLLSLVACGDASKPAATPAAPPAADSAATASPPPPDAGLPLVALPAGVPDSPAGHQLAWVLAAFGSPPDEAAVTSHFATSFTAQVPVAKVVGLFAALGSQLAPLAIDRVELGPTPDTLRAIVHADKPGGAPADAPRAQIDLAVDATDAHPIVGLTIRPSVEGKAAASWDDVQKGLRAVAPSVAFLAAEIGGGKCVTLASVEPKKPLALGSAFKLYVLNALATQIAAGKHKWDETIAIDDAKKSLPSGELRDEAAGKTFTVREFAEKMISVSDNTAADHLLAFVGRPAVEAAVKATGSANYARDVPFPSTRDLFALKLLGTADELHAYGTADVAHKRKMLDAFEARDLSAAPLTSNGWDKPRAIDTVEWFASPEDLCKLMVALKTQADAKATSPVGEILAINPGIPDEKHLFKYIAFKGGSEPGVMNLTWLTQRASDGKWLFLTAGFNDSTTPIDEQKAIIAASVARDFLGNVK